MEKLLKQRMFKIIVAWMVLLAVALPVSALAQPDAGTKSDLSAASSGWQVAPAPSTASMYGLDMIDASDGWSACLSVSQ